MTGAAWSCFTHTRLPLEEMPYEDLLGRQYTYDSHVPNHSKVAVGDLLVLRDAQLILGFAVVERIAEEPGLKQMARCPRCRSTKFTTRKTKDRMHRCTQCLETFDVPLVEPTPVIVYKASYARHWYELDHHLPVRALEDVYAGKDRQNAIRRLDPIAAQALLRTHTDLEGYLQLEVLAHRDGIDGGHIEAMVRRRIGQREFRERLLERYGPTCAVTGAQPDAVLDAAHLYSYASHEVHEVDGGLLLRADVHRMFDRLLLTFDPRSWRSVVAPPLLDRYAHLHALDGREMAVPEKVRPREELLKEHYRAARERWKVAVA